MASSSELDVIVSDSRKEEGKGVSLISKHKTKYTADCVEFCPAGPTQVVVCGCYMLTKEETRVGSLTVHTVERKTVVDQNEERNGNENEEESSEGGEGGEGDSSKMSAPLNSAIEVSGVFDCKVRGHVMRGEVDNSFFSLFLISQDRHQ
tara:strand:+ start:318 stop:764 length:447 start_codon:yes stop_codon:yes gene_type:complete